MIRTSPISGSWYAGDEDSLRHQLVQLFVDRKFGPGTLPHQYKPSKSDLIGVIAPHAGFHYSGYTAAWAFKSLAEGKPDLATAVIIGPNHRGIGPAISVSAASGWETPLGIVELDVGIIDELGIRGSVGFVEIEDGAHVQEHSIEIQLPFLQFLFPNIRIVPISLKDQTLSTTRILGKYLGSVLSQCDPKKIVIVASTDLSHDYDQRLAKKNDGIIIDAITSGDVDRFHNVRVSNNVTMCGYGPVSTLLHYASHVSNQLEVEVISYSNSAEITGKSSGYTVGYLAATITGRE